MGLLALALACLGAASAKAELLQFSATDFILRCAGNCNSQDDGSEVNNGVLITNNSNSVFYKAVAFPRNGERVCSFSMVYHDVNASDTLTARLIRKGYTAGGNPFAAPIVMASVVSAAGTPNTVRIASDPTIVSPTIQNGFAFYYVQVNAPTFNLNLLGVRIDVRPTCP